MAPTRALVTWRPARRAVPEPSFRAPALAPPAAGTPPLCVPPGCSAPPPPGRVKASQERAVCSEGGRAAVSGGRGRGAAGQSGSFKAETREHTGVVSSPCPVFSGLRQRPARSGGSARACWVSGRGWWGGSARGMGPPAGVCAGRPGPLHLGGPCNAVCCLPPPHQHLSLSPGALWHRS